MSNGIYTIGHSTHSINKFLNLIKLHQIEVVADVRSSPYSKINSQYNREELKNSLKGANILYVFLGQELGARSDNPGCYVNDKVQYNLLSKTELFQSGISRLIEGASTYRVALMCAEKEPLDCHRTILIAHELDKRGIEVMHILSDGTVEKHKEAINRLIKYLGLSGDDMFTSRNEIEELAYSKQAEKISYDRSAKYSKSIKTENEINEPGPTDENIHNRIH